jgi:hypothetical protein
MSLVGTGTGFASSVRLLFLIITLTASCTLRNSSPAASCEDKVGVSVGAAVVGTGGVLAGVDIGAWVAGGVGTVVGVVFSVDDG